MAAWKQGNQSRTCWRSLNDQQECEVWFSVQKLKYIKQALWSYMQHSTTWMLSDTVKHCKRFKDLKCAVFIIFVGFSGSLDGGEKKNQITNCERFQSTFPKSHSHLVVLSIFTIKIISRLRNTVYQYIYIHTCLQHWALKTVMSPTSLITFHTVWLLVFLTFDYSDCIWSMKAFCRKTCF